MAANHVTQWVVLLLVANCWTQAWCSKEAGADDNSKGDNYGVLVDAGSSSSKIKIYRWREQKDKAVPLVDLINNTKMKPAINDYSDDMEGLGAYIDRAIKWAMGNVPSDKHRSTPFLLQATAGMRFFKASLTIKLMSGLRSVLANTSRNPFAPSKHDDISVISGEEEAVFGWIAANYLNGFFDSRKPNNESVGLLEMGGGSTQIAFIPEGPLYAGEFHVIMGGRRHSLYVHSFLDLGASAIKREILSYMVTHGYNRSNTILEPCMLQGDQKTSSLGGIDLQVNGSSNGALCSEILAEILKPAEGILCQPKPCSIRQVYQPSVGDRTYYATSAFEYAPKTLGAVRDDGSLDLEGLQEVALKHCSLTLEEAIKQYPDRADWTSSDCMMATYIPLLFHNYGFSPQTHNIILTSTVKSQRIDWALGSMLMKLSDRFRDRLGLGRHARHVVRKV